MSMRIPSKDSILTNYNNRDVFGFKPFASKQIIIMTSKEGIVTCQYPGQDSESGILIIDQELYDSMSAIVEEIIKKVEEITIDGFVDRNDFENEKNDPFEVIPYPVESQYFTVESKGSEYLDTIEENDMTETETSLEMYPDDVLHSLNDEEDDVYGSVHDIHDGNVTVLRERSASQKTLVADRASDMSLHNKSVVELTISDNCEHEQECNENASDKSLFIPRSATYTDSDSTIKTPKSEEISVEKLLNYLRRRNAAYNYGNVVADID